MKKGFNKAQLERTSVELRKCIGLNHNEPIDCLTLLKHLPNHLSKDFKIRALQISEMSKYSLCPTIIDTLCGQAKKEFSAVLLEVSGGFLILYNQSHSDSRITSTLAHEISHIVCGHKFNTLSMSSSDIMLRQFPKEHEDEANWLAGCILLPREGLLWALKKGMNHEQIASHFSISIDMVRWRYNSTGVKNQLKYIIVRN
jgi:IrrE N-terminal-like domain